jgi:tetratricopeptide (TPR) repeat protein
MKSGGQRPAWLTATLLAAGLYLSGCDAIDQAVVDHDVIDEHPFVNGIFDKGVFHDVAPSETGVLPGTPGLNKLDLGDRPGALTTFESENRVYPNNPYVEFNLAYAYKRTGDRDLATKYYEMTILDGKDAFPDRLDEAPDGNTSLAEAACIELKAMGVDEPRCRSATFGY